MKFSGYILTLVLIILILGYYASITSGQTCTSITATTSSQYIESHSSYGTANYTALINKCWTITTSDSSKIVMLSRYGTFQVEGYYNSSCLYDRLRVYDSATASGTAVNFCGTNIFTTLYSSGRSMYLRFTTDLNGLRAGFKLRVSQVSSVYYSSARWSSSYYTYSYQYPYNPNAINDAVWTFKVIIYAIVGSIVGLIILIILCCVICCCVCCKKQETKIVHVVAGMQEQNRTGMHSYPATGPPGAAHQSQGYPPGHYPPPPAHYPPPPAHYPPPP